MQIHKLYSKHPYFILKAVLLSAARKTDHVLLSGKLVKVE